jgi:hypothetical protein
VTTRSRALAAGVAVVAMYAGAAWLSGQQSPLARRPLLDGLAPPAPYRWVDPPPELAGTNQPPSSGTFPVALGRRGSLTAVVTTEDALVTLILPKGSFASAEDERRVEVTIEPLAPSDVGPVPDPLQILGNVYRIDATYVPSGDAAPLVADARVVLTYPFSTGAHPSNAIVSSEDGTAWTTLDTNDLPSIQQADAAIDALGYTAVVRTPSTASPGTDGDSTSDVATYAIIGALLALAAGAAIALRGTRPSRPARGAGRGSRRGSSRSGSRSTRRG